MKNIHTALFSLSSVALSAANPSQPNIILILADDMGYSDLGCYGSEIKTPHLDSLAATGLRFSQFYNAGRSCPSRSALLTGLYPHQAGVGDMLQDDGLPAYGTHLNMQCVTLAEMLKSANYHTIMSGKWHVGSEEAYWPQKRGFDDHYYSNTTTGHYFGVAEGRKYIVDGKDTDVPGEWILSGTSKYKLLKNEDGSQWYATDAITNHAMDYIKKFRETDQSKPYFLYLAYTAPHWPLHAFEEDIANYQGAYLAGWDSLRMQRLNKMIQLGLLDEKSILTDRNELVSAWETLPDTTKVYYDRLMSVYAAMIDRMDQNIGRLLNFIRETNEIDNTVIIFLSDNGGSSEVLHKAKTTVPGTPESYDSCDPAWANLSNTPFKWFKHWTHEGGVATPLIVWYPEMIKEGGRITNAVGYIADVMPTLAELAGAKYPLIYRNQQIIPTVGESLVPVLKNEKDTGRELIWWEHEGNRAIRKGDWKIVSRYKKGEELPWELYNLAEDRTETIDLSKVHVEKLEELVQLYHAKANEVQAIPYKELQQKRKTRNF